MFRPVIEDAIQQGQFKLEVLAKWVQQNAGSAMILDAELLKRRVAELREAGGRRENPTKAASSDEVAALLESGLLTSEGAARARRQIQEAYEVARTNLSLIELRQFGKLSAALMKNPHYAEEQAVQAYFNLILLSTLRFQHMLENIEQKRRSTSKYLFDLTRGKGGPQEADLQHDYLAAMQMSLIGGVRYEESGKSHGRTDVSFASSNISIVAEIKQEERDRTLEQLVDDYGLQAAAYQRTDVRLGLLLVLDLFDRGGSSDHFEEMSAVLEKTPPCSRASCSLAVFRIQGRKRTPSSLSKAAKALAR